MMPEGVTQEVAERLFLFQPRCVVCGGTYALHIHHRIFRSEGEVGLKKFLEEVAFPIYKKSYGREIKIWFLHSIQNLVVLCKDHHEGDAGIGVHGGNEKLRQQLRNSFTCPKTGFNVPYIKNFKA